MDAVDKNFIRWKEYKGSEIPGTLNPFPVFFEHFPKEGAILDMGCGYGRICRDLLQNGFRSLVGLDFNINGLMRGRREAGPESPLNYCAGSALASPFRDSSFNGIIMQAFLTTLPEVYDRRKALDEAFRLLKPNGLVYAAVFGQTWENPVYRKRYEQGMAQGLEKGSFEAVNPETGAFEYRARHFTKEELFNLFNQAGFNILSHQTEIFTTRTGNKINGHVIIAGKPNQPTPCSS